MTLPPQARGSSLTKLTSAISGVRPLYIIIMVPLALVVGLMIWWFFNNFERVTITEYELTTEAQYNPYYAAERLINQHLSSEQIDHSTVLEGDVEQSMEQNVTDSPTQAQAVTLLDSNLKMLINDLPAIEDNNEDQPPTLIINSIGAKLTKKRFAALKSWIEQGGHVVTFASGSVAYQDMQAVLDRLEQLHDQHASTEDIANDQTLAKLTTQLDGGNELLSQLGIFAVSPPTNDNDDDIEAQLEAIITNLQNQSNDATASDKDVVKHTIDRMNRTQPLTLLTPSSFIDEKNNRRLAHGQAAIMVQSDHTNRQLNAALFEARYADKAKIYYQNASHSEQDYKTQAQLLRHYLATQRSQLSNYSANSTETKAQLRKLNQLLDTMIALDDKQLLKLFKPADDIFLQAKLGKGRLSILLDNNSFTNPNPSLDLPKSAQPSMSPTPPTLESGAGLTDTLPDEPPLISITPLYELLSPNFRVTLLSGDNAAWLLALTEDSSQVWILPNTDVEALPVMLWKEARLAVIGLGLLTLIWLWSLYNRFGKIAVLTPSQSHDILRYFRQVGRFGWQQDRAVTLSNVSKARVWSLLKKEFSQPLNGWGDDIGLVPERFDDRYNGVNNDTNNSDTNTPLTESTVNRLSQLLLAKIEKKKQLLSTENNGQILSSPLTNSSAINQQDDNTLSTTFSSEYQLLIDNEAFIKSLLTPDKLRSALQPDSPKGHQVVDFTQMTQTLWLIQWLLK